MESRRPAASLLAKIFAKSPFRPMVEMQSKVEECVAQVPLMIEACLADDHDRVLELAKRTSVLEYEVDLIKTRLRDQLPSRLFLPVGRADLLNALSAQDTVADCAEDIGVLLSMRRMEPLQGELADILRELVAASIKVVKLSTEVVNEVELLAKGSFSGPEARRVLELIDGVDREEHLVDKVQDRLAKAFFEHEDEFKPAAIYLWIKIFNKVGDLANHSEKMTHRIRLFLAE